MSDPQQILDAALSLPPTERAAFIALECGDDSALRTEVERRLDEYLRADQTLATPPDRTVETPPPASVGAQPGDMIGRYKLLQRIGEGGFGSVYMAEQTEPVRRRVALKIIKLGMDTKQVIARFEAERQALAMMDHPNIAKVLDAGATETGRPYFVMELVRGVPITEYADTHSLGVNERLRLFIDVCHAIQHAHQKGIIHRDLKPSNILVTLHDTVAVPKVIDFGIAKATSQRLTEKTLFTEFHQFVGTPQYMSPEQAEMSGLDVDTRSDVYSLGTILYELLVGTPPFDAQQLAEGGLAQMSQFIRETEPPGLGQRFTMLGAGRSTVAQRRGTEPDRLAQELRGDLQSIITKSLEKDRTRRYESASQFADDVERHLRSEPILAVPPSALYRLRKFVRRNRGWVATAALVTLALAAGLAAATVGWLRAERELERSEAMSAFLQELHVGFDPFSDEDSLGVDELIGRCRDLFGEDHATIGSLLFTRASLLTSWGRHREAEAVLDRCLEYQRKSLAPGHEALAATLGALGNVRSMLGKKNEARLAFEDALSIHRDRFGPESLQAGESAQNLAGLLIEVGDPSDEKRIEAMLREATAAFVAHRGENDTRTVQIRIIHGMWLQSRGRGEAAIPVLDAAIAGGRAQAKNLGDLWIGALNSLTIAHMVAERAPEATASYEELLGHLRERGMSGSALVTQLHRFITFLSQTDQVERAEEVAREALEVSIAVLPLGDDQRHDSVRALANVLTGGVKTEAALDEAEAILGNYLRAIDAAFDREDPRWVRAHDDVDRWYRATAREGSAAELLGDDPPTEPANP